MRLAIPKPHAGQPIRDWLTADVAVQIAEALDFLLAGKNISGGPGIFVRQTGGMNVTIESALGEEGGGSAILPPFWCSSSSTSDDPPLPAVSVKIGTVSNLIPLVAGSPMIEGQLLPAYAPGSVLLRPTFSSYNATPTSVELLVGDYQAGDYRIADFTIDLDGAVNGLSNFARSSLTCLGPMSATLNPIWLQA